jgi:glucose-1-phosphate thymidylyltransferase
MKYKGILLAGGNGTRLSPVSKVLNKQLIPIYDKPLIFYSLSILMLSNIREILIICKNEDKKKYFNLFGHGERLGLKISYDYQDVPKGIPEGLVIGEKFIGSKDNIALILGDNFFYGQGLSSVLLNAKKDYKYSTIFLYNVKNPENFGIVEFNKKKISKIIEKPKKTNSTLAITGLYFFKNSAINVAKGLKNSKRNETEIVDVLKFFLKKKQLKTKVLGRGYSWLDTGTFEGLFNATSYVHAIESRQEKKIACLEEIALKKKWINKNQVLKNILYYGNCEYSSYLKKIIQIND